MIRGSTIIKLLSYLTHGLDPVNQGLPGVIRNGLEQMKTLELKCALQALSVYSGKRSGVLTHPTQNIVQISVVNLGLRIRRVGDGVIHLTRKCECFRHQNVGSIDPLTRMERPYKLIA